MNIIRRFAIVIGSAVLAVALVPGVAHAAAPQAVPVQSEAVTKFTKVIETVATAADLAPALSSVTAAQPGEGVIRITTRVCGNANNWQNVAKANGIVPPVYLVLLGQKLTVACSGTGGSAPAPAPAQAPAPQPQQAASAAGWVNPLPGSCIISPWGQWRGTYAHQGVDLPAGSGTPIRTIAAGTVHSAAWMGGGGYTTVINHGNNLYSVYMHQSRFNAWAGQWLGAGAVLGYVGSTGDSTGPHLHLEVHPWGLWRGTVNPIPFLAQRGINIGWC